MPALSAAIGLLGIVGSIGGGVMGFMGNQRAAAAQQESNSIQRNQALLDAARSRRQIARQAIVMRASALSTATNQGAGYGASSGLAGGMAGVENQAGSAMLGLDQNTSNMNALFASRQDMYSGESEAMMGQGISQFGGMLTNSAQMFGKVGSYLNSSFRDNAWGGRNLNMFGTP